MDRVWMASMSTKNIWIAASFAALFLAAQDRALAQDEPSNPSPAPAPTPAPSPSTDSQSTPSTDQGADSSRGLTLQPNAQAAAAGAAAVGAAIGAAPTQNSGSQAYGGLVTTTNTPANSSTQPSAQSQAQGSGTDAIGGLTVSPAAPPTTAPVNAQASAQAIAQTSADVAAQASLDAASTAATKAYQALLNNYFNGSPNVTQDQLNQALAAADAASLAKVAGPNPPVSPIPPGDNSYSQANDAIATYINVTNPQTNLAEMTARGQAQQIATVAGAPDLGAQIAATGAQMDAALAQYLSYAAATQLLATGHPGAAAVEMSQAGGGDAANPGLYVAQAKADYVAAVNAYNNAWYSFQDQTGWSHSDVLATPLGQTPQTANLAAPNAPTSLVAPALCGR